MVWPFSRKQKVPKVPFPEDKPMDEGELRFPEQSSKKEIKPDSIKKAAGLKPIEEELPPKKKIVKEPTELPPAPPEIKVEPLYIKIDVYQRILGELETLKTNLGNLGQANKTLESSEYNEEANFDKLRRSMKNLHDRLLQVDKILFKP